MAFPQRAPSLQIRLMRTSSVGDTACTYSVVSSGPARMCAHGRWALGRARAPAHFTLQLHARHGAGESEGLDGAAPNDKWRVDANVRPSDMAKERARTQRRTMFTHADWRRHRSGLRYLHHFSTIPDSGVVRAVVGPVVLVTVLAAMIATWNWVFVAKVAWLPRWLPQAPAIAIEPIQLTSMALSLLLVFRTNASYARWEEARRCFGSITTTSRDIARQAFSWFPATAVACKARLARWLVALARSSMAHVRDEHDLGAELAPVLAPDELAVLLQSTHRPNFCLQMLTKLIWSQQVPHELLIRLDENMSHLVSAVSACERILNTPVPLSYTRHTARFLMAWLVCMTFTLWPYCGWWMVPLAALISFVLLGIEEIGVYIEEPFSVMALERLCDRLEVHIGAMMREQDVIQAYIDATNTMGAAAASGGSAVPIGVAAAGPAAGQGVQVAAAGPAASTGGFAEAVVMAP